MSERTELFLALRDAGCTAPEIAKMFNMNKNTVYTLCWRARNPEKAKEKRRRYYHRVRNRDGGKTAMEILSSRKTEAQSRAKPIVKAVDSGLTYGQVAKQFGLTRCADAGIMHRHAELTD